MKTRKQKWSAWCSWGLSQGVNALLVNFVRQELGPGTPTVWAGCATLFLMLSAFEAFLLYKRGYFFSPDDTA